MTHLTKCLQLIIIDNVMTLPVNREDSNQFFVFINQLYETTSFIITTNKSPAEWAQSLDDKTLATALLDRFLLKCQLIQLKGKSYRMQNRKTIFENETKQRKYLYSCSEFTVLLFPKYCILSSCLQKTNRKKQN